MRGRRSLAKAAAARRTILVVASRLPTEGTANRDRGGDDGDGRDRRGGTAAAADGPRPFHFQPRLPGSTTMRPPEPFRDHVRAGMIGSGGNAKSEALLGHLGFQAIEDSGELFPDGGEQA